MARLAFRLGWMGAAVLVGIPFSACSTTRNFAEAEGEGGEGSPDAAGMNGGKSANSGGSGTAGTKLGSVAGRPNSAAGQGGALGGDDRGEAEGGKGASGGAGDDLPFAQCENGKVETGEECDDENDNAEDGCNACEISRGYTCGGEPSVCKDTNECTKATADCSFYASCTNTPGSYVCTCKPEYAGDGRKCLPQPPAVVSASSTTCVYSSSDLFQCWGAVNGTKQRVGLALTSITSIAQVSMGQDRACELTVGGEVLCWGAKFSDAPSEIAGLGDVVSLSFGAGQHTCAVLRGGTARCWGANDSGQLGDGTKMLRAEPVEVGLSGIVQMSVGTQFSCALLRSGEVRCWGDNSYSELGDGSNDSCLAPVTVSNLPADVVRIVSGPNHTCALSALGRVSCWGSNGYGQLGKIDAAATAPVEAGLAGPARDLAAGSYHTCAILADDTVSCWGQNNKGQIGSGAITTSESPNALTLGPEKPTHISAGAAHTCVRLASGKVKCWGWNVSGQLGNDDAADSAIPVDVVL